jgi:hypothetical protein
MVAMLWGYVITGIVGITGTCLGAWLTGRWQTANLRLNINAERQRAMQAENRLLYTAFLSAYHRFQNISMSSIDKKEDPGRTLYREAFVTLLEVADQISLSAPIGVNELAVELARIVRGFAMDLREDRDAPIPPELGDVRTELIYAMRKDLGLTINVPRAGYDTFLKPQD